MTKWVGLLAAGMLLSAGCTTSMKGTPFYSGEYENNEGPAADRVNLWPLLYYRDPALSVLWPLMEFSPGHQAVRPVYSGYNLDTEHPVYNVLWPIGRFDPARQDYRIFPVYWGDDYCNVFPLYWHEGQPLSGTGHDALLPLWIWKKTGDGDSLHLAWPFYARHRYSDRSAWHLWPLYGMKQTSDSVERSVVWPLMHAYTNNTGSGNRVLPVYAWSKTDDRSRFLSLPYSRSLARRPGGRSWDMLLPLGYRQWQGDQSKWMLFPALSGGKTGTDWKENWFLLGLGRYASAPESRQHHLLPLYLYRADPEATAFYTLPWWRKTRADGSGFSALLPIYYHGYSAGHASFYSLPWLKRSNADGSGWHASFPLYYRGYSDDASSFYSLLWSGRRQADGTGWDTAIPFYYRRSSAHASAFYSPVWMSEKHADGTGWKASFPFYYSAAAQDGSVMITPFYARKRHADGSLAWRTYIPFVYVNDDYDAHFMTLLGGRWRLGEQQNWLALPLLSGGAKEADSGRNIYLGGLAAQRWNPEGRSHYVFPFYYRAPRTLISLPYAGWADAERQNHAFPLLLSGGYSEADGSRAFLAAGLAGYRKGMDPYHYLFPLYYAAPDKGNVYSLPYSRWRSGERTNHLVLPLLSGWHSEAESSGGAFALGLAGYRKGGAFSYSYLAPFYYAAPEKETFLSLPYATWSDGSSQKSALPLLLSGRSRSPGHTDYLLLGGLGHWRKGLSSVEGSHLFPLYMWAEDDYFYSLIYGRNRQTSYFATPLAGRYENGSGKAGSWVAPFYWHKRTLSSGAVKGYYFPLGYYSRDDHHSNHGFLGLYDRDQRTRSRVQKYGDAAGTQVTQKSESLRYLLSLGESSETWTYAGEMPEGEMTAYRRNQSFFPLWHHRLSDNMSRQQRLETSSWLGILHDTRREQEVKDGAQHDYFRRRVLWRLYHQEKLNGDTSVDIFPGITVDSYQNGYYKLSVLWRLFRYENDPESGDEKLDLLFLPLKR